MMAKQMSLIKNIDIGYFALKSKESLVITRKFENIFNLVLFHTSVIIVIVLFVLRFYGPVNPVGSCRARSVYLTTRLLGRLSPQLSG